MISPGGCTAAALLALLLPGCSPGPGPSTLGPGHASPASPAPPTSMPTPAVASSPSPAAGGPTEEQPAAGGLFGSQPAGGGVSSTTTVAPAADRTDPAGVARAYATGLYTVDWTRPLPGAQKLAAAAPWATPSVAAKLARGQHYQPPRTDPRVAAGQVDTVKRVVVEEADPVPGGNAYLATIHIRTHSAHGVTTTQAFLLITIVPQAGGWLVDDSQVVG